MVISIRRANEHPLPIVAPNIRNIVERRQGQHVQTTLPSVPQSKRMILCFGVHTVLRVGGATSIAEVFTPSDVFDLFFVDSIQLQNSLSEQSRGRNTSKNKHSYDAYLLPSR
jgi:hypothetical protein